MKVVLYNGCKMVVASSSKGSSFDVYIELWHLLQYGDGTGNTIEENSSIFSLIRMC